MSELSRKEKPLAYADAGISDQSEAGIQIGELLTPKQVAAQANYQTPEHRQMLFRIAVRVWREWRLHEVH